MFITFIFFFNLILIVIGLPQTQFTDFRLGPSRRAEVFVRPFSITGFLEEPPQWKNPDKAFDDIPDKSTLPSLKLTQGNDIDDDNGPPPHQEVAKMSRYIVNSATWTSLATISTRSPTIGSPFTSVLSVSDGPYGNSTGVPYFYMTPIDLAALDLAVNSNASLMMTLAQTGYCLSQEYDPEDPRCAVVTLTGSIVKLNPNSDEGLFAKKAMFSKHPAMKTWPKGHHWFFAKLDIKNIIIRDFFGGAVTVPTIKYFEANPAVTSKFF